MSDDAVLVDEIVQHLGVLEVREGDVLVLQLSSRIGHEALLRIKDMLGDVAERIGMSRDRCVVVDSGATLGVIRKAAA